MLSFSLFAISFEGFWDRKLTLLERALFTLSTIALLSQDSLIGWESQFELVPNTHILGIILFSCAMILHKLKRGKA